MQHAVGNMLYLILAAVWTHHQVLCHNSTHTHYHCGPRDCYEARYCTYSHYRGDGVFPASLTGLVSGVSEKGAKRAFCEPEKIEDGGRKVWTTLLTRNSEHLVSETDFAKGVIDPYSKGFGDSRNNWLGADVVHEILRADLQSPYRVRLLVNGEQVAICYSFYVDGAEQGYRATFKDCSGRLADALKKSDERQLKSDCDTGDTYWWFDEGCTHAPTAKSTSDVILPVEDGSENTVKVTSMAIQFRMSGEQKCSEQCNDRGICIDDVKNTGTCECDQGHVGDKCQQVVTCKQETCLNGGVCGENGQCSCVEGYHGALCAIKEPCRYHCVHGTCDALAEVCVCKSGYRGARCNVKKAYLEGSPPAEQHKDNDSSSLLSVKTTFSNLGTFGFTFFTGFLVISILIVITSKIKKDSKESIESAQPIRHYAGWEGESKHPLRRGTREILTMEQFYLKRDINLDAIHLAKGVSNIDSD